MEVSPGLGESALVGMLQTDNNKRKLTEMRDPKSRARQNTCWPEVSFRGNTSRRDFDFFILERGSANLIKAKNTLHAS